MSESPEDGLLRLATYNIQAGIGSRHFRHLFTHSMRYLMPHRHARGNLERIAHIIEPYDFVAVQESDAGSFRTDYLHQTEYLAVRAGFPHASTLVTREIGNIACLTQGILSRIPWTHVVQHRLPASKHGRGAIETHLQLQGKEIVIVSTHLSLSKSSRMQQMRFLARLISDFPNVVLMGDLNCSMQSSEFEALLALSHLRPYEQQTPPATYPSWAPIKAIDHILVGGDIDVESLQSVPVKFSDHLPVAATLRIGKKSGTKT